MLKTLFATVCNHVASPSYYMTPHNVTTQIETDATSNK